MTLRTMLFAVLGMLGGLLLAVTGILANGAWSDRTVALNVVETNTDADMILRAERFLVTERDATALAIASAEVDRPRLSRTAQEARQKSQDLLSNALKIVENRYDFPDKAELLAEIAELREELIELRGDSDAVLAANDSDPALAREVSESFSELIDEVEVLRLGSAGQANRADALTGVYSILKGHALVLAEYLGREQTIVGEYIAEDFPLPPGDVQTLYGYRGNVERAWDAIDEGISSLGLEGRAAEAAEAAEAATTTKKKKAKKEKKEKKKKSRAPEPAAPIIPFQFVGEIESGTARSVSTFRRSGSGAKGSHAPPGQPWPGAGVHGIGARQPSRPPGST